MAILKPFFRFQWTYWLLFIVATCLLFPTTACEKKKTVQDETPWPRIVKELKVIQALRVADSTKIKYIEKTFDQYGITLQQFQEFVQERTKKSAGENILFLKSIEQLLIEEMKAEAKKQVPRQPKKPSPQSQK